MTRWRSSGNGSEEEMKSGQDIGRKGLTTRVGHEVLLQV